MQFQIVASCPLRVGTCGLEDRGSVLFGSRFSVSQFPSNRPNTPTSLHAAEWACLTFLPDDGVARS